MLADRVRWPLDGQYCSVVCFTCGSGRLNTLSDTEAAGIAFASSVFKNRKEPVHNLNTRTKNNLHLPSLNLSTVQKGVLYSGSSLFNILPSQIKCLSGDLKLFKRKLKSFLLWNVLYSLDEFYQLTCKN